MKKIAIIPARSGSKGLPNKNVLLANGLPLAAYSITAAINSQCFDDIIFTTDSEEYIELFKHYPITCLKREPFLATDTASSYQVIEDVLKRYSNPIDYFVLLQPTSPLRKETHIQEAIFNFEKNYFQFDFLVSMVSSDKNRAFIHPIDQNNSLKHFSLDYSNYQRQNQEANYTPNGAIFIGKPIPYQKQKHFFGEKSMAYIMDKQSSVDIDNKNDFEYFYYILNKNKKTNQLEQQIEDKSKNFKQHKPITFIGHSILNQWKIHKLNDKKINNLAIDGISSKEYLNLILKQNKIKKLGEYVVLMTSTNDIIKENFSSNQELTNIQEIIKKINKINKKTKILFIEITPTAFRLDRDNKVIKEFNTYLKNNLQNITWIPTYDNFLDSYQKLSLKYTHDGLHLNQNGYKQLQKIITKYLL